MSFLNAIAAAAPLEIAILCLLVLVVVGLAAIGLTLRRTTAALTGAGEQAAAQSSGSAKRPPGRAALILNEDPEPGDTASKRVCPTCSAEFQGMTFCTRDARRLVSPATMLNAGGVATALRHGRNRATEPAGVIARICPLCASKYDLNARFCGRDGGELIVIN